MQPQFGTITGTVSYLQRIALPSNAVVQIELEDVSRADAPAFILSSQQLIAGDRQVPFSFSLNYDAASIVETGRYNVRARIFIDGTLRWMSDTATRVITNEVFNVDMRVVPVSG
jgi:putative lipoprotein